MADMSINDVVRSLREQDKDAFCTAVVYGMVIAKHDVEVIQAAYALRGEQGVNDLIANVWDRNRVDPAEGRDSFDPHMARVKWATLIEQSIKDLDVIIAGRELLDIKAEPNQTAIDRTTNNIVDTRDTLVWVLERLEKE